MIRNVFRNEFKKRLRSKAFLIITFGGPILLTIYVAVLLVVSHFSVRAAQKELEAPMGVYIDGSLLAEDAILHAMQDRKSYTYSLPATEEEEDYFHARGFGVLTEVEILHFKEKDAGIQKLQDGLLSAFFVLESDFQQTGMIAQYTIKDIELGLTADARNAISHFLSGMIHKSYQVPDSVSHRLRAGFDFSNVVFTTQGKRLPDFKEVDPALALVAQVLQWGTSHMILWVMLVTLALNSHLLFSCMKEERENKVFELLLTSITAEQLITGKVLAIVATGVLQILVWLLLVVGLPLIVVSTARIPVHIDLSAAGFALTLTYTFLGLLLYGYCIAGLGAFVKNTDEWNLMNIISGLVLYGIVVFLTVFLANASTVWWRGFSLIPFFTPILIPIQLVKPTFSLIEGTLYLLPLTLAVYVAMRLSAKLFRLGIKYQNGIPSYTLLLKDLTGKVTY